ncbi:MAG: TadE/TadG family type IV pilus assembly protein [Pseudomonadota bacterium]
MTTGSVSTSEDGGAPGGGRALRRGWFGRWRRRRDGSISIEFAFLGPVFLLLLFGIVELVLVSLSGTSVRVGLQDVARDIRVGQAQCITDADVRERVCQQGFLFNCQQNIAIDRARFSAGPGADAVAVAQFSDLQANDVVLITADYDYAVINPLLTPFLGDGSGVVPVTGGVVFKSENFVNVSCP